MITILQIFLYAAQAIALGTAFYYYSRNKHTSQKYFLHFLVFVITNEIIANIARRAYGLNAVVTSNLYIIVSCLFFCNWFYSLLHNKKWVYGVLGVFCLSSAYSIIYEPFATTFSFINLYVMGICVLALSVIYLRQLLLSDAVLNFKQLPSFWIATGIVIFNLCFIPLAYSLTIKVFDRVSFQFINMLLNIILYSSYSYGLHLSATKR